MLLTQISSIKYLLRQGLLLRVHDEQESNLIQLMKLRSQDINGLKDWLNDKKYLSRDIVNELAKEILPKIIRDISQQILNVNGLHSYVLKLLMKQIKDNDVLQWNDI
ncbi:unnamed protein product [Didymodactylos carnosus]|uniref:Uncharacterized protein n=1 Tax=Didymodactylos carnosus TaxID=1234261 RepID=A0A814SBH5_9BILA|nr:unnamed protein product [Didymodactylos carnosus]CAF1298984.1 unnamed protein product [Didymodactylos carnosus]CAF3908797.1 unnamed protein product [Didymodactylos carnosus]CAF4104771.1 unnamed protein product [Didymodactylos carnosus]